MKSTLILTTLIAAASIALAEDPTPSSSPLAIDKFLSAVGGKAGDAVAASQKRMKEAQEKADALFKRSNELLTKQEADTARYEKILDTWEKQQAQYQTYLDSLPKK